MSAAEKREAPSLPIPSVPSIEEAALQVQEDDTPSQGDDSPMAQEEFTFDVDVVSRNGKRHKGTFANRILTPQERIRVGQMQAAITGNTPWDALDPDTQFFATAVSHMMISLSRKPTWFVMSGDKAVKDLNVIIAVYNEVSAHEAFFRQPGKTEATGES